MEAYKDIVHQVLKKGKRKHNRTGVDTIAVPGAMFEHDMSKGFPLLTSKYVHFTSVASELEFFIKGGTDKQWLQERNNTIWNEWCCPDKVPYGTDEDSKTRMFEERDLGPVYGFQWRHFGAQYKGHDSVHDDGVDQLREVLNTLRTNPEDRRMIVSAWNPQALKHMALPPCHYAFQLTVIDNKLNLLWNQRSVDVALGLPFNIASYGLLLHLFSIECGIPVGKLVGFLADTHIYLNHVEKLEGQMERKCLELPQLTMQKHTSFFDWEYKDAVINNYQYHPSITYKIAV